MDHVDEIFRRISQEKRALTLIACFFTGKNPPVGCAPMPRNPSPPTGQEIGENFGAVVEHFIALNPSVHDGAIMIGRITEANPYRIFGWSFRLFPPEGRETPEFNRGSAFNSCVAMSEAAKVDMIYCVGQKDVFKFINGNSIEI